jgi:hypothetical protein
MKLMVPDIVVPASGEKTLRQYKVLNISSPLNNFSADLTVAVTNRRLIQHAETAGNQNSQMIHNEIFINDIGGFTYYRDKMVNKKKHGWVMILLFVIFAALGGLAFWQAQPICDFIKRSIPTVQNDLTFKIIIASTPILIFLIIVLITNIKPKRFLLNMIIYTKGLNANNLFLSEEKPFNDNFIIIPYLKETKSMISELAAIVLDIQKFGAEEVLKYIDPEDAAM